VESFAISRVLHLRTERSGTSWFAAVLRIFADAVAGWYRKRHAARGLPDGETGAITAIQREDSDLRRSPHIHTLGLDGIYSPDRDGEGPVFHPTPTQEGIKHLVERVSKPILRFLQRRGIITNWPPRAPSRR